MKFRRFMCTVLTLMLSVVALSAVAAEDPAKYPTRTVKVIVPFGAGGSADLTARNLMKFSDLGNGQSGVVVNMPGGGGTIGVMEGYNAKPDGYTLLSMTPAGMIVSVLKNQLPADIFEKMTPLCVMGIDNPMFCIGKDAPYKTAQEFFDYVKANPGKLRIGGSGMTTIYINALIAMDAAGLDMNYVSFNDGSKSRAAMLGGHVEALISMVSENRALIAAGDLIPLFVYSEQRSPFLPDVPTLAELTGKNVSGCPGFRAMWAPSATPKVIIDKLEEVFQKTCANPEHKNIYLEKLGIEPADWNSAKTKEWVEKNLAYYKELLEKYSK